MGVFSVCGCRSQQIFSVWFCQIVLLTACISLLSLLVLLEINNSFKNINIVTFNILIELTDRFVTSLVVNRFVFYPSTFLFSRFDIKVSGKSSLSIR